MANISAPLSPEPWRQFSHPVARDLAWIIASPSPMSTTLENYSALEFDPQTQKAGLEWLKHLETFSPHTLDIDRGQFRRLGLYFEALLAFLFRRGWEDGVVPYQLLERNIRISDKGVTLGELDMVLVDRRENLVHLECAVKFYLAHRPDVTDWRNWIGPNGSDRLDLKLRRMLDHQLPLSGRDVAQPALRAHGLDGKKIQPRYFLRGMFFPHQDNRRCLPFDANPEAQTGEWLRREQFDRRCGPSSDQWQSLVKLEWLGGSDGVGSGTTRLPRMLWRIDAGKEQRLMLVEDYWPETSSPSRRI